MTPGPRISLSGRNVIAEIEGRVDPERVFMMTAHLDSHTSGTRPPWTSPAPGADDNASGSAAVLLTAAVLSQYDWDCTLRFALWTGEEQGLFGSTAYANRIAPTGENIIGVLNLDMLAWNTPGTPPDIDLHANWRIPGSLDLAWLFQEVVTDYGLHLTPEIIRDGSPNSDHSSFWKHGYPTILAIEDTRPRQNSDFNPNYHTVNDLSQNLDYAYFTEFIRAALGAMVHGSNCLAQTDTATLLGVVRASDGLPLPAAHVVMTDTAQRVFYAAADASGAYSRTLPTGVYTITVTSPGFEVATQPALMLPADADVTRDFLLTPDIPVYTYRVLNTYPHDPQAFTQGLVYQDDIFYEGTGLYGRSSLRKVTVETGAILQLYQLPDAYFGEGIALWGDKVYQLTWRSQVAFVYDKDTFTPQTTFSYPTEGWGLTQDGRRLIMSDGSAYLYFRDPDTFAELGRVEVRDDKGPVARLNELEYIDGEVFANIWVSDRIARIYPETGRVVGWIDLTGLLPPADRTPTTDVLNGIAYDDDSDRLFVTGKHWPKLFEIALERLP